MDIRGHRTSNNVVDLRPYGPLEDSTFNRAATQALRYGYGAKRDIKNAATSARNFIFGTPVDPLSVMASKQGQNIENFGSPPPYKQPGWPLVYQNPGAFSADVINRNQNIPFVNRMANPSLYPSIAAPGGGQATHEMASGDNYAWPTIQMRNGLKGKQLIRYAPPGFAADIAFGTNNVLRFDSPEQAAWFANNGYKQAPQWQQFYGRTPTALNKYLGL